MKVSGKRNTIYEYDVLRTIVTVLVVLGHSKSYTIMTKYGGMDYSAYSSSDMTANIFLSIIIRLIYAFHMPLFMFLSGALFFMSYKKNKYNTIKSVVVDKSKRLLIPFVVVTLLYVSPVKYLSGYWSSSDNVIKDIILGQLFLQGNSHLWFLAALFGIFIMVYLIEKYIKITEAVKIFILLCLYIVSRKIPVHIIQYVFQNALWFYLGYLFEPRREKINMRISAKTAAIATGSFAVLFILSELPFMSNSLIQLGFKIILSVIGCSAVYMIAYLLSDKLANTNNRLYKLISEFSFGIYLYSDPLNYLILFGAFSLLGEAVFSTTLGVISLFVSRFVITFAISLLISVFLKKAKIKYIV